MYDRDKLIGIVGKYVDDCLICGDEENMKFLKAFSELRHAFKLGGKRVHRVPNRLPCHL